MDLVGVFIAAGLLALVGVLRLLLGGSVGLGSIEAAGKQVQTICGHGRRRCT